VDYIKSLVEMSSIESELVGGGYGALGLVASPKVVTTLKGRIPHSPSQGRELKTGNPRPLFSLAQPIFNPSPPFRKVAPSFSKVALPF